MLKTLIHRPIGIGMSLIVALLLGVIAYQSISLQLFPDGFDPPFFWVSIPTLSATTGENEITIAEPVEDALRILPNIKTLNTYVRNNSVGFAISLHPQSDVNLSYQRIRSRLRAVTPKLPEGAQFPYIWRHNPNDTAVQVMGVRFPSNVTNAAQVIQDSLITPIERLKGISRVELGGVKNHELRITLRNSDLKRYQIDSKALIQSLTEDHFTLSAGLLKTQGQQAWVRVSSRFENLEALGNRPIGPHIKLSDVARIEIAPDPTPLVHRINGGQAASMMIYKASTANTIEMTGQVRELVDRLMKTSSELKGYELISFFDQGEFIMSSLTQIEDSALYGGMIALVFLFIFLRTIPLTLMITCSIPVCLLSTIALLYLKGESLNLLSMMGLILSVGMVIDNSIVVLEQVYSYRKQGIPPIQAAIQGASKVALAITLATLTTLVVFLPLMMTNNQPMLSFFMGKMGTPVCYGLLISLLIALIHLPTASQFISIRSSSKHNTPSKLIYFYQKLLRWTLEHRLAMCFLTLFYLASISYPQQHLKRIDQGKKGFGNLKVNILGPANGSHHTLDQLASSIEKKLLARKNELDIKSIIAKRGWSTEHIRIELFLNPNLEQKMNAIDRKKAIQDLLPKKPGYRIQMRRGEESEKEGVAISVYGPQQETAQHFAEQLVHRLKKVEGVEDVLLDLPEGGLELTLQVDPHWSKINQLNPYFIASSINAQLQKRPIGEFYGTGNRLEIILEPETDGLKTEDVATHIDPPSASSFTPSSTALSTVSSTTSSATSSITSSTTSSIFPSSSINNNDSTSGSTPMNGASNLYGGIPLDHILHRKMNIGTGRIKRKSRKVHVTLNLVGEESQIMSSLEQILPTLQFPIGYGIDRGDRFSDRDANEEGGKSAVLIGMVLVFCLMGILFESFLIPLTILFTIPLAFVGAIWMLWFTDTSFEIMAIIGGVVLVGVVVNNGIVLIDQIQAFRRSGMQRNEALLKAASARIRPILMTASTTIGGLIPMAIGNAENAGIDYRPLGRMVIGGLVSSTLLTLVILPLFYTLLDDLTQIPTRVSAGIQWIRSKLSFLRPSTIRMVKKT